MTRILTADLYDLLGDNCSSCETQFKQYGGRREFFGRIQTVKCRGDNTLLHKMLSKRCDGDVLVVDGSGYLGCALMGDMIARLGATNGWSGVVIYGAIRDASAMRELDVGVKALGTNPKTSAKKGLGDVDSVISFGGVNFTPGHWIYSDDDGILVSREKHTEVTRSDEALSSYTNLPEEK